MKTSFYFFTLFFLIFGLGCSRVFLYTDIKKIPGENLFEAKGFFSNDPIPMLVNDPIWLGINTPKPDNAYILLSGSGLDSILSNPNNGYFGAPITVRGVPAKGLKSAKKGRFSVQSVETNSGGTGAVGPNYVDHCTLYPALCTYGSTLPHRYALLYSGGKIEADASKRYWNDLELMYLTLRSKCGFDANNIIVVYKNGLQENLNSPMRVNYAATKPEWEAAINALSLKMSDAALDTLFIFATNHGGGYATASPSSTSTNAAQEMGGVEDSTNPDEQESMNKTDEVIYCYAENGIAKSLRDDTWASKLNTLFSARDPFVISLYEQCFSGGFLWDMRSPNPSLPSKRINIAAASEFGFSYGMPPDFVYDTYSYYFTLALLGHNLDGSTLGSNLDVSPHDGKISIWEAFQFARINDPGPGHENFLDDTGNGTGVIPGLTTPTSGNDGFLSNGIFLRW